MGKVYWPALTEAAPAAAELVRSLRFEPDDVEEQLDDAASTSLDAVRFPLPLVRGAARRTCRAHTRTHALVAVFRRPAHG